MATALREAEGVAARAWEGHPPDSATYLLMGWQTLGFGTALAVLLWARAATEFCKEVTTWYYPSGSR
jgi:hypothetical protein